MPEHPPSERPSSRRASSQQPHPWHRPPWRQTPWRESSSQEPSSQPASSRQQPWERQPSSRGPWWPCPLPRRRSSQPLVDLLNLDEVCDGLDVAARLRVVGANGAVTDALETEASQRVALVLLLAHLGL